MPFRNHILAPNESGEIPASRPDTTECHGNTESPFVPCYQIVTRSDGSNHIGSSAVTPNVS